MPSSSAASSWLPPARPAARSLLPTDRGSIARILAATEVFSADERRVALELVDGGEQETPDGYHFLVAEADGEVAGFACFGHAPCTEAAWDLYWIAVDRQRHGRGIGRSLLQTVEDEIRRRAGRIVLAETSSKAIYVATRAFYEHAGYVEEARIKDFYAPDDDKVVYSKRLG